MFNFFFKNLTASIWINNIQEKTQALINTNLDIISLLPETTSQTIDYSILIKYFSSIKNQYDIKENVMALLESIPKTSYKTYTTYIEYIKINLNNPQMLNLLIFQFINLIISKIDKHDLDFARFMQCFFNFGYCILCKNQDINKTYYMIKFLLLTESIINNEEYKQIFKINNPDNNYENKHNDLIKELQDNILTYLKKNKIQNSEKIEKIIQNVQDKQFDSFADFIFLKTNLINTSQYVLLLSLIDSVKKNYQDSKNQSITIKNNTKYLEYIAQLILNIINMIGNMSYNAKIMEYKDTINTIIQRPLIDVEQLNDREFVFELNVNICLKITKYLNSTASIQDKCQELDEIFLIFLNVLESFIKKCENENILIDSDQFNELKYQLKSLNSQIDIVIVNKKKIPLVSKILIIVTILITLVVRWV